MAEHRGKVTPILSEALHPNASRRYFVTWDDIYPDSDITSSSWVVPVGFLVTDELNNVTVTYKGKTYNKASTAIITPNGQPDETYLVQCSANISGDESDTKGFRVVVKTNI